MFTSPSGINNDLNSNVYEVKNLQMFIFFILFPQQLLTPFKQWPSLFRVQSSALREGGREAKDPFHSSFGAELRQKSQAKETYLQPSLGGPPNWMWCSATSKCASNKNCHRVVGGKVPFKTFTKYCSSGPLPLCSGPRSTLDVASLPRPVMNSFILSFAGMLGFWS